MTKQDITTEQIEMIMDHMAAMTALEELSGLTCSDDPNYQLLRMTMERLQKASMKLYLLFNPDRFQIRH